ncbi:hypothetical protein BGZ95_005129 [Linnemannia exigua]|uniref:Uncharacterized protein n=1 Tax=Linnemannia exigua TaxID=604196 RepID=A0AAD4DGX0_9FUNG|nr:hypothetical protein BGZ95_005129 [Linnemannia exigua]
MANIKLPVELGLHGIIAFLSLYAVCSILATIRFQNLHGYTSLTALFLFFVTGVSFVMAIGYMVLAWWTRSPDGSAHIRSHIQQQQQQRDVTDVERMAISKSGETFSRAELVTRAIVRICVILVSPLPRLCILIGLMAATFLATMMQWYKIRNAVDCAEVAPEYRHFCATTKAAVTSTTVTAFGWMLWLVLWFRLSYRFSRAERKADLQQQQQRLQGGGHGEQILIAMPDEAHVAESKQDVEGGVSRVADMSQSFKHIQHSTHAESHLQHIQNNRQTLKGKSLQQQRAPSPGTAVNANDSSLGLGIDITNQDSGVGTSSSHSRSNTTTTTTAFESMTPIASRFKLMDAETASIVGKNASLIARDSIVEQEKPNPGRLRDHAKIFPLARASLATSQIIARSPSASGATTPTTPVARAGYMGKETYKAFNNVPRSASMSAIVACNKVSPAASSSAHVSPIPNFHHHHHFGDGNITGTPNSIRSHRSMAAFPQSPAQSALAEQSMDEQLKAIRRRSFANDVMNSPGGSASLLESAQMNSPYLETPHSEFGASLGVQPGSPSSILSKGKGRFRAAFSSPNLNTAIGTGRRRSSLGMSSMVNSIVNSPVDSDSLSSASYHSLAESSTTPPRSANSSLRRGSDTDNDGQSSLYSNSRNQRMRQHMTISAQELLRAEYGDLYPALPGSSEPGFNDMENMNPDTDSITSSMGRPRSNSVSSAGTSRSSDGSSSYSSSNETQGQGRGVKPPGPPPSFMNKVRNGSGYRSNHKKSHKQQQQQQQTVRRVGSNGTLLNSKSNNNLNNSRKFPSHGDLTKYSWDYRREMPID